MTAPQSHETARPVRTAARILVGLAVVVFSALVIAFIASHGWATAALIAVLWLALAALMLRGIKGRR